MKETKGAPVEIERENDSQLEKGPIYRRQTRQIRIVESDDFDRASSFIRAVRFINGQVAE